MNNVSPIVRKIIYIVCIGCLLIPISQISRPETREKDGSIRDAGGKLSILREEYDLSQAKMSEIDPASETMKLASLGLRGVAVNILWMQALEHQEKENYDQYASTLQSLIKIQPNFVKVWEFQAHNLAYNVSMEFDDYEYRYHWVKKGINFLKQGIPYNKRDHRVTDKLGFFIGNKFGKSDEQLSFRRMFRKDGDFHQGMSDYIEPESYDQIGYGPDSWLLAWQWYDYSRKLVEDQSCDPYTSEMLRFMRRPEQKRNQAITLQSEFKTDEIIQEVWRDASDQWTQYGNQPISNSRGVTITMEGMTALEIELEELRDKLDLIVPDGTRKGMFSDLLNSTGINEEQQAILEISPEQRTDEQTVLARRINQLLARFDGKIDLAVAITALPENRFEANKIVLDIESVRRKIQTINKDAEVVNYRYWRARNKAESEDATATAQKQLYEAREMWRQSIYDDEYDFDYKTKTKTVTQRGAMSRYLDTFALWKPILESHPELNEGSLADDLIIAIKEYHGMLRSTNREWPDDFPLQALIDQRFVEKAADGLPTTDDVDEAKSLREQAPGSMPSETEKPMPAATENDSPENDSPENDSPENDSPENDSPENDSPVNESNEIVKNEKENNDASVPEKNKEADKGKEEKAKADKGKEEGKEEKAKADKPEAGNEEENKAIKEATGK